MVKIVIFLTALTIAVTASPNPQTLVTAPIVATSPIHVATSQSAQYFVRNFNTFAAPLSVEAIPVAAKIEAEPLPVPVAPIITSRSSQYISRNHNFLATPAAAILAARTPVVPAAPAQLVAQTPPVVTSGSSQYFIRNNNFLAAPLVAAPLVAAGPTVPAEKDTVVVEARSGKLNDKLKQSKSKGRVTAEAAMKGVNRSLRLELLESNSRNEAEPQVKPAQVKNVENLVVSNNARFVAAEAPFFVGPRFYL